MNEYEAVKRYANALAPGENYPATTGEASQPEILRQVDSLDRRLSTAREIAAELERRLEHVVASPAPVNSTAVKGPEEVVQSPLGNRIAAMERDLASHCYALQALIVRLKV